MEKLYEILKSIDMPVSYHHFKTPISPPFITYYRNASKNFIADDKVYKKINIIKIELYTKQKDIQQEEKLEQILDENNIDYQIIAENYIDSEKIYQTIYEIAI